MSTSRPPSRTCAMRSCCGEVSSWRRGASLATHSARDLCCSAGGEREQSGRRWGSGVRTELPVPDYGRVGAVYGDLRHEGGGETKPLLEAKLLSVMYKHSQNGCSDKRRAGNLALVEKVEASLLLTSIQNGLPFRRPSCAPAAPPAASPGLDSPPPFPRNSGRRAPKGARLSDRRTPEAAPRPPRPGPRGSRALQPRSRRRARLSPHVHLRLGGEEGSKGLRQRHE